MPYSKDTIMCKKTEAVFPPGWFADVSLVDVSKHFTNIHKQKWCKAAIGCTHFSEAVAGKSFAFKINEPSIFIQ